MNSTSPLSVVVIVLNWNGAHDTLECLESIEQCSYNNYRVLVVDNGSTDNSVLRIRGRFPDVWMIETGENLGFAGGNNVGIRAALATDCDVIVLLNNDTTVAKDWLTEFDCSARNLPSGSVLGAQIYYSAEPDLIWHFGALWDNHNCKFKTLGRGDRGKDWCAVETVDMVIGCCMWIPCSTIREVGYLEESFFLNYEETDWCFRAKGAGYMLYSVPSVKIWHKISASFQSPPHNAYFIFRNRRLWVERQFKDEDRSRVMHSMVIPDERRVRYKYLLRSVQRLIYRSLGLKLPDVAAQKLQFAKAALAGISDYKAGRFGNCPAWIHAKGK